jgi:hypothetical protein
VIGATVKRVGKMLPFYWVEYSNSVVVLVWYNVLTSNLTLIGIIKQGQQIKINTPLLSQNSPGSLNNLTNNSVPNVNANNSKSNTKTVGNVDFTSKSISSTPSGIPLVTVPTAATTINTINQLHSVLVEDIGTNINQQFATNSPSLAQTTSSTTYGA